MSETTNDTDLVPAWAVTRLRRQEIFTPVRVQKILAEIQERAKAEIPDLSTAKGRAAGASLAHKVARSKTFLDDAGKEVVAEWKKQAADVDVLRKTIRDSLDALKVEVRAPLDAWEEAEKERKRRIDAALLNLSNKAHTIINSPPGLAASVMEAAISFFEADLRPTQEDFADYFQVATENYERCLERMRAALEVRRAQEAAAEAERRIKAAERAAAEAEQAAAEADRRAAALQRELEEARAPKAAPEAEIDRSIPSAEEASALIEKLQVSAPTTATTYAPTAIATPAPSGPVVGVDVASGPDRIGVAQILPGSNRIFRDFGAPLNRDPIARINLQTEIQHMIVAGWEDAARYYVSTNDTSSEHAAWNDPPVQALADKIIAKVCDTLSKLAGPVAA
jgi:hypothetical protein